jgi:DNA repair protein RecN (Recombination protein N)
VTAPPQRARKESDADRAFHPQCRPDRALDLAFPGGLGVLTGETGAGKSILLDLLGLVLGDRADSGLVRAGEDVASVTASFEFARRPEGVEAVLAEAAIDWEPGEPLLVRRRLRADGGSRAYVNDQPVGVALLRELARFLVELHGQHDDRGLVNARGHRALLDRYARADAAQVAKAWDAWRAAEDALAQARAQVARRGRAGPDRSAPGRTRCAEARGGRRGRLALQRAAMQKGEKLGRSQRIAAFVERIGRAAGAIAQRGAAARPDRGRTSAGRGARSADRAVIEAGEAEDKLAAAAEALAHDPALLDRIETRLFDCARRPQAWLHRGRPGPARRAACGVAGDRRREAQIAGLARVAMDAGLDYRAKAEALSVQRAEAARKLDKAVAAELAPLRLDAARFHTAVVRLPEERWSAQGMDAVEFLISTNPAAISRRWARLPRAGNCRASSWR